MIERKTKIRLTQIFLLLVSIVIIFTTYFKGNESNKKIVSNSEIKNIVVDTKNDDKTDVFYNIEYSGLDLEGNRYILQSSEAAINKDKQEIINMKLVSAKFFLKDDTVLYIESDKGIYNNKTLDMDFFNNVKVNYEDSKLFGNKVSYLNSKRTLLISDNVKVEDIRGVMVADKLLFDLEKKTLDISSYKDKINANVNLK